MTGKPEVETITSNSSGNNGSYEAEGNFDGNNPSDSIYEEASGQAKLDALVSQLSETEDISGAFTLDNSLSDQDFYNKVITGEQASKLKPIERGKKGAITETVRRIIHEINDKAND